MPAKFQKNNVSNLIDLEKKELQKLDWKRGKPSVWWSYTKAPCDDFTAKQDEYLTLLREALSA